MPLAFTGFWFGLGLTLCFVPGVTGVSILTGWPLMAAVLPFFMFKSATITPIHWLLAIFLSYVMLTFLWTDNGLDGIGTAAQWVILGMAFHYGSTTSDSRPLYVGVCAGLSVSVGVALAQSFGWEGVAAADTYRSNVTGLFFNSTVFGSILAMSLVMAVFSAIWWYVPIGAAGLFMSGARAAGCAVAAAVMVGIWRRSRMLALVCIVPTALFCTAVWLNKPTGDVDNSMSRRAAYWLDTAENTSILGSGVGSFFQLYPLFSKRTDAVRARPEHAYSDFLEIIFEFGLGSMFLWVALAMAWEVPLETERLMLFTFLCIAVAYFPLAIPVTAFLMAFATGRLAREWALVRNGRDPRGSAILQRVGSERHSNA